MFTGSVVLQFINWCIRGVEMERLIDRFFGKMSSQGLALAYSDVRLRTQYSDVLPQAVDIASRFSRKVPLKIPFASAAMDTVTEHKLAIALAMEGGIGVLHRNMPPAKQVKEVARVKWHMNGFIPTPISVSQDWTVERVKNLRHERGYRFSSFLVTDENGRLVGVLTGNDFEFCQNDSLLVSEVMTRDPLTAPEGTSIDQAFEAMVAYKRKLLPIVNSDGSIAGLFTFSDVKDILTGTASQYNLDSRGRLRVAAAIGVDQKCMDQAQALVREQVDALVIDTAHAHSYGVMEALRELKRSFPTTDIVAGNVSEGKSAYALAIQGADGIKVGQGPGSICTTRIVAGIGCPQLTAVYECAKAVHGMDVPVCADGGIKYSGDVTVALAAGADCVMLGGMLAGTDEAPGEVFLWQGRQFKRYRGMGSAGALNESAVCRERYSEGSKDHSVPEGVEGRVPYRGPLRHVIRQFVGGLRKGMGYTGSKTLRDLWDKADFWYYSTGSKDESHVHDVEMTVEPPNYRGRN